MLKKVSLVTLVCLVVSLWAGRHAGSRIGDRESRHIRGLAKAAVLVTGARTRETGGSSHAPETGGCAPNSAVSLATAACPPAAFPGYILPSLRIATHLSL